VVDDELTVRVGAGTTVFVIVDGHLDLVSKTSTCPLSTFDAVVVTAPTATLRFRGHGRVVRVDLTSHEPAHNPREHR
jgi:hypothetical protein